MLMNNEPNSFDLETQRLLDKVCEGVEVPEDVPPVDDLEDDFEDSTMDDGYGSLADDAWHDANEYPDW